MNNREMNMRRITVLTLWVLALSTPALMAGAGTKEADDGIDVYFRDAGLLSVSDQGLPKYPTADPGDTKVLERAWETAPPSIPHTVEDMYPILLSSNECLACHSPENAIGEGDIPLSETHFDRPQIGEGKGPMITIVKGYERGKEINMAQYNCNMCHTPVASNVDTPSSKFVEMQSAKEKKK